MKNNEILNDETLEILGQQAINQAMAGADIIAPSDTDGRKSSTYKKNARANTYRIFKLCLMQQNMPQILWPL